MTAVQNLLVAAIVTSRAGRQDLHDQVGRTLDVGFGYYVRTLVGNEQNVRLGDILIRELYIQRGRPNETQISVHENRTQGTQKFEQNPLMFGRR